MASRVDQDFLARLEELNKKFAASIPATLDRLRTQQARLDPAAPSAAATGQLHQELHTIAGSAATFGYRAFGQQARTLEQRLRVLMAGGAGTPDDWAAWLRELDAYLAWSEEDPRRDHYPGTA